MCSRGPFSSVSLCKIVPRELRRRIGQRENEGGGNELKEHLVGIKVHRHDRDRPTTSSSILIPLHGRAKSPRNVRRREWKKVSCEREREQKSPTRRKKSFYCTVDLDDAGFTTGAPLSVSRRVASIYDVRLEGGGRGSSCTQTNGALSNGQRSFGKIL